MQPSLRRMDEQSGRYRLVIDSEDVTDEVTLMQFRPALRQGGAA